MRLRYIVSAPHRHGREARKPAAGTFTSLPHTHMHAHTPSTHTCTNGHSLNVGVAHTHIHIYTHTHSSRTLAHLQSCIIKPIKEMSLISRGVSALVHHWGFLAGAGDMQSSSSSLWDLSHHALIRHSSKLYWDSWFSRAGLAHKSIQSSSGHLWMRFKGFENESGENVGLVWHTATSLACVSSVPHPPPYPLIEKPVILFPLPAGKTFIILTAEHRPTGMSESGFTTMVWSEERRCRESNSRVTLGKYPPAPSWKLVLFSCFARSNAPLRPLDHLQLCWWQIPSTLWTISAKERLILQLLSPKYNSPVTRSLIQHTFSRSACVSIWRKPTGGRRWIPTALYS